MAKSVEKVLKRRMSGGIGAKRVDVTWATEESGLLLRDLCEMFNCKRFENRKLSKELDKPARRHAR